MADLVDITNDNTSIALGRRGVQGPAGESSQPRTSNMHIAGHSFMADGGVSVARSQYSTGRRIKEIFGVRDGCYFNIAVSGGAVAQHTSSASYRTVLQAINPDNDWPWPPDTGVAAIMWSTNDQIQGATPTTLLAYREAMNTVIARYCAAKVFNHNYRESPEALTFSGDWTETLWRSDLDHKNAIGSGTGYWSTNTVGSYLEFDTPDDFDTGYINLVFLGGYQGGSGDIYVDGVLTETVSTSGLWGNGSIRTGVTVRVPVDVGTHTIKIECTGTTATGTLDYNCWQIEAKEKPIILLLSAVQPTNTRSIWLSLQDSGLHDAYNETLQVLAKDWNDPYIRYVDCDTLMNGNTWVGINTSTVVVKTWAEWQADVSTILSPTQLGFQSDTGRVKIGDGVNIYQDLPIAQMKDVCYFVETPALSGTAASLASNATVVPYASLIYETDTGRIKIGDGVHKYSRLDRPNGYQMGRYVTRRNTGLYSSWENSRYFATDYNGMSITNTEKEWEVDTTTILASGQAGITSDRGEVKLGNGTDVWADLDFMSEAQLCVLYKTGHTSQTAAAWAADATVIVEGVMAYESDTGMFKIGNGSDRYSDLINPTEYELADYLTARKATTGFYYLWNNTSNGEFFARDGLHPNEYGTATIAELTYKGASDIIVAGGKARHFAFPYIDEETPVFDEDITLHTGEGTPYGLVDNFDTDISFTGLGGDWVEVSGAWGRNALGEARVFSPAIGTPTLYDIFDRADSASSLGGSWTAHTGTWGVKNRKAYLVTNSGSVNIATVSQGTADHYVSAYMTNTADPTYLTSGSGLVVRYADSTHYIVARNTASGWVVKEANGAGEINLTPSVSVLGGAANGSFITLEANGADISLYANGALLATAVATLLTGTRCGMYVTAAGLTTDRWSKVRTGPYTLGNQIITDDPTPGDKNAARSIVVRDEGWSDGVIGYTAGNQIIGDYGSYAGLAFRVQDYLNYYAFYMAPGFGACGLYKVVNGVQSTLDTSLGLVSGSGVEARVVMNGNDFECYAGGTLLLSATDSTFPTETKHGLMSAPGDAHWYANTFASYFSGESYIAPSNKDIYVDTRYSKIYPSYDEETGWPAGVDFGATALQSINAQVASYTAVLADGGRLVEMDNGSANNFTIPENAAVAFPIGTRIDVVQKGAGQTTIDPDGATVINATPGLKLRAQYSAATIEKVAVNTWYAFGDLAA